MEELFLTLVNLSLTASWLVLAVLVLRLLLRKAPRWSFCLLWGLVALRLMFPFSLESPFSLVPSTQPLPRLRSKAASPPSTALLIPSCKRPWRRPREPASIPPRSGPSCCPGSGWREWWFCCSMR